MPGRPAALLAVSARGVVAVWDLLESVHVPVTVYPVTALSEKPNTLVVSSSISGNSAYAHHVVQTMLTFQSGHHGLLVLRNGIAEPKSNELRRLRGVLQDFAQTVAETVL
jgi:hypothetical protein